jgi:outer membrane protein TolC
MFQRRVFIIILVILTLSLIFVSRPKVFSRGQQTAEVGPGGVSDVIVKLKQKQDSYRVQELSAEQVGFLSLYNSLDVQIAKYDTFRKRTSLKEAESIFDTYINANIDYNKDKLTISSSLAGSKEIENSYSFGIEKKLSTGTDIQIQAQDKRIDTDSAFATINPSHEAKLSATLKQSLGKNFFGIVDRSDIKITKIDIENSKYSSLDDIENIIHNSQVAYWQLVYKQVELSIREQMLDEAGKVYEAYKQRYDLGLVEEVDLYAIRANMRSRENDVASSYLDVEIAKNNLLFLLNQEDTLVNIRVLDSLELTHDSLDVYNELNCAIGLRRDYKVIENQIRSQGIDIAVKKNALWPEIDLEASFIRNGIDSGYKQSWKDVFDQNNPELSLGLSFRMPLEKRKEKSQLDQAKLYKQQLILSLKRTERLILKQIHNNVSQANMLKDQVGLLNSVVELHENKLKDETKRFNFGRSNTDTLIRYTEDLLKARLELASVLYDYQVSLVDLELGKNSLLERYWKEDL